MFDKSFSCELLTPEGAIYKGQATSVVAPGADGQVGILSGHAPLITALGKGELRIKTADGASSRYQVAGGFMEVLKNKVTVLAERAEAKTKS
ncbi:MAG: ATP synthase F1 subunit epsilon [Planctomycetota bacterium]